MRMGRAIQLGSILSLAIAASGCATTPPLDNPVLVRRAADGIENPVLVSPGAPTATSYHEVFNKALDVLDDYFLIFSESEYEGRIVTRARFAPGYEQIWKIGNPDPRNRLLATFQSIRQQAVLEIRAGERGGYLVYVIVNKELEDVPRPSRAVIGSAVFQEQSTVDRQLDVVGQVYNPNTGRAFIPIGRDWALEQQILQRMRECR